LLRSIEVQAADFFGGGRLGFLKFKAEVSNEKGERLPGSVFLRGGSVAMMVRAAKGLQFLCVDRQSILRAGHDLKCYHVLMISLSSLLYSRTTLLLIPR